MALRVIIPVSVAVTAATVTALNTAVASAVTAAIATTDYIPNSVEVNPDIVTTVVDQTIALYQTVSYKKWGADL
jgi:hypothetical protein